MDICKVQVPKVIPPGVSWFGSSQMNWLAIHVVVEKLPRMNRIQFESQSAQLLEDFTAAPAPPIHRFPLRTLCSIEFIIESIALCCGLILLPLEFPSVSRPPGRFETGQPLEYP